MPFHRSLISRIVMLTISGVLLLGLSLAAISVNLLYKEASQNALKEVNVSMRVAWNVLSQRGSHFSKSGDLLLADNHVLNNDFELVDKVKEIAGGTATIFRDDIRVTTNIRHPDGTRAVGTRLMSKEARKSVFDQKKPFRGIAEILDEPYMTAYDPLLDKDGNVVGVLYVGLKKSEFYRTADQLTGWVLGITLGIILLASIASFFFARKIVKPVKEMTAGMRAMASGNLQAKVPTSHDVNEIADMANALEVFRENAFQISSLSEEREQLIKAVQRSNAAKSDFLANMSHEIRTPMSAILAMSQFMLDTKLTSEQKRWAEVIHSAGEELLGVINDILDFSKIEAGFLKLEAINFNLRSTITEVVELMKVRSWEKGVEILVDWNATAPTHVVGDPVRLKQILYNLIGNAIKFTEKGYITLRLRAEPQGNDGLTLFTEVEDTGIGIPENKLDYIFEKFSQAEEATTRKYGGTGLGLAITQKLVNMMGGTIGVRSTLGQGSTFFFDIHLGIGAEERPQDYPTDASCSLSFESMRILAVEDIPINLMLLLKILERHRCPVDTAANGALALERVKEKAYDLIFMDCQMPILDGYETTQKIRELEKGTGRHVPIVALTADAMAGDREKCLNAGMDDYLYKPFKPAQITAMLEKWQRK